MASDSTGAEMSKALFVNLVMMFTTTAMQQLGKLVNPVTRKVEVDLQGAQASIDILTMLAEKTRGNLDKEEGRLLRDAISSLQMNYVETAESPAGKTGGNPDEKGDGTPPAASGEPKGEAAGPEAGDESKRSPKFHKNYGEC